MKFLTRVLFLCCAIAAGTTASAATISGRYLVTVHGHPSSNNGTTLCAVIVQDGSTLGFAKSGTLNLQFGQGNVIPGYWFRASTLGATFEASNSIGFITFSGDFGKPMIQGTSFMEVVGGAPVLAGNFTAVKGGC